MSDLPHGAEPTPWTSAYDELADFAAVYGREALSLACHIAVFERFRPEVVALVRANFLRGIARSNPALDAMVLFGPLSEDLGGGYFSMDRHKRRLCLRMLDQLGSARGERVFRSEQVAELALSYVQLSQRAVEAQLDPVFRDYLNQIGWVALAFVDPETAVANLFLHVNSANRAYVSGIVQTRQVRFGGLASILEIPAPAFMAALDRARAIDAINDGDYTRAVALVSAGSVAKFVARGVSLLPMEPALERLEARRSASPPEGPTMSAALAHADAMTPQVALLNTRTAPGTRANTPLHEATIAGRRDEVHAIIAAKSVPIDEPGVEGKTALHLAAERGFDDIAVLLLDHGAFIEAGDTVRGTPLYRAAANGRDTTVSVLLSRGADANAINADRCTPLMAAAYDGHSETLDLLLQHGAHPNAIDKHGHSALAYAVSGRRMEIAYRLLAAVSADDDASKSLTPALAIVAASTKGMASFIAAVASYDVPIDEPNDAGYTPLMCAAWFDDAPAVEVLLELGADPNRSKEGGRSSLHLAAESAGSSVVRLLHRYGGNPSSLVWSLYSPMSIAAGHGSTDAFEQLAIADPSMLGYESNGMTPLHSACARGRAEMVTAILARLATDQQRRLTRKRESPLSLAVLSRSRATVEALLAHPATQLNGEGEPQGEAPIQRAVSIGAADVVETLLADSRVDRTSRGVRGESLLHLAINAPDSKAAEHVLAFGTDVNAEDDAHRTPLGAAIEQSKAELVELFLRHGADPNRPSGNDGATPLALAIVAKSPDIVRILIGRGANVAARLRSGDTCLHLLARLELTECLALLLDAGLGVDSRNASGDTALHVAVSSGSRKVAAELLEAGAVITATDSHGRTALHRAVANGSTELIETLLTDSVAVDVRDDSGCTPLHLAVYGGTQGVVHRLLDAPCEPDVISLTPAITPLQIAVELGLRSLIQPLLRRGADPRIETADRPSPLAIAGSLVDGDLLSELTSSVDHAEAQRPALAAEPIESIASRSLRAASRAKTDSLAWTRSPDTGFLPLRLGTLTAQTVGAQPWELLSNSLSPALKRVLSRDQFSCAFCGFVSAKYHDVVVRTDRPVDIEATHPVCAYCQSTLFLDLAAWRKSAALIWLPDVSAASLNALTRVIYAARISSGPVADKAREILQRLLQRREVMRTRYGFDDPAVLAAELSACSDEDSVERLRAKYLGVLVLPIDRLMVREDGLEYNKFPQMLAYSRSKNGPMGKFPLNEWDVRPFDRILDSDLAPATIAFPPGWIPMRSDAAVREHESFIDRSSVDVGLIAPDRASGLTTTMGERRYGVAAFAWERAAAAIRDAMRAAINSIDSTLAVDERTFVDHCRLPWYRDHTLIRIQDTRWRSGMAAYYLRSTAGSLYRLEGTSPPIHEVNGKESLALNRDCALDYLRFFCFFVRGAEGPFYILESLDDPLFALQATASVRADLNTVVRPAIIHGQFEDGRISCRAIVWYSNGIFAATLDVQPGGAVEMLDDQPLADGLTFRIDAPLSL